VARRGRRGLSEAVTIMVVILVAVVAALGIKAWFDAQASKLPTTEMATADWSATFSASGTTGRWLLVVNVRSNLDRNVLVTAVRVVMSDGAVLTFTTGTATYVSGTVTYTATATPAPTQTVSFKGSQSIVLLIPVPGTSPTVTPKVVEVQVQDSGTGSTAWVRAVGGVQA